MSEELNPYEQSQKEAIERFVARVNARAEADMLNGRPVTGAHHRALEAELKAMQSDTSRAALGRRGAQEEREDRRDGDGPALHQPQRETSNVLGLSVTTGNMYFGESAVARHHPTDSPSAALRGVGVEAGAHGGMPKAKDDDQCGAPENPAGFSYECTLQKGHDGPHVAHGANWKELHRWAQPVPLGTPQEKEPLLIPDEVERTIPHTPDVNYAIKALDAAALWPPEKMLELADTLERAPHWAMCEAQYLRGIASRLTQSVPLGTLHQEEKADQ